MRVRLRIGPRGENHVWALVPNPSHEGKPKPDKNRVKLCHDGTPFLTIACNCGCHLHLHESQIEHLPDSAELASHCHACAQLLVFDIGRLRGAIHEAWA